MRQAKETIMTIQKATVSTPRRAVYQVIVERVDVTGWVDDSMPVVTLPAASYHHAVQIARAINNPPVSEK